MIILRQSTASQEVPLGYFLDSTDGNTEETALSIANTDIKLWKSGATTLANKNSGGATHISNGVYYVVLDATDTNTIGPLVIFVHVSGSLSNKVNCLVLDEAVYDVIFGTTALSTYAGGDTSGVTTLLSRLGTPANLGGGATIAQNLSDIEAQTDDIGAAGAGLTAVPWNAAWDAEVQSEVQDAIEVNHLDHLLAVTYDPASKPGAADALLNELVESDAGVARYTANALEQAPSGGGGLTAGAIADAVWDEATAGHTTSGTFGEQAKTDIDGIVTTLAGHGTTQGSIQTTVNAIIALLDDPRTEPGQGALPVNPDLATKIDYIYKFLRNKKDNNGTENRLYADNGVTIDHKQSTSVSGGTVTKGEWITGA